MIWATVSSPPWFCRLYRVSTSLAAKNIISLILVLTIWWCPCVESSPVLLEEGVCYDQCVLLAELLTCFVLYPKAKLPVTPGVSWLPTFAFYKWKNAARPSQSELVLLLLLKQLEGQLRAGCLGLASAGATLLTSKVFSSHWTSHWDLFSPWWQEPKRASGCETDSRSSWKELESPISNSVDRERGRNWDILAVNPLHRTTTLVEMEIGEGGCNSRLYFLSKHPAFM